MKRSISVMIGKGSVNHNSRQFHAKNTDPERSHLNRSYVTEPIQKVYHELFDEAVKNYNAKQSRSDRCIPNYYEKIRAGKQEKSFHEIILQIGNRDDMGVQTEDGQLAAKILDEYMSTFQERNPNLHVFSAHLHMDEATPHLHIDFVPYITGSKRGLDTRVSLKQALASQGFHRGARGNTEWNQWVQAEKEQLAVTMEHYGVEWERKGLHEKHLSVLDYEKKMRTAEIAQLGVEISNKKDEFQAFSKRIENFKKGENALSEISKTLDIASEYQLPDPQALMSAKSYKTKFAEPLIKQLKALVKTVMVRYFQGLDNYERLNQANGKLYRDNESLRGSNEKLSTENSQLKGNIKDYMLLRKVFGNKQIDSLLEQARTTQKFKQRDKHFRSNN